MAAKLLLAALLLLMVGIDTMALAVEEEGEGIAVIIPKTLYRIC